MSATIAECAQALRVLNEQQAEITRLREENARLRSPDLRTVLAHEAGQADAQAEIARLRELLGFARHRLWSLTERHGRTGMDEELLAAILAALATLVRLVREGEDG